MKNKQYLRLHNSVGFWIDMFIMENIILGLDDFISPIGAELELDNRVEFQMVSVI
jgi:hypothetical protein